MILFARNKAVADGAISFYLDHRVSVRVAKKTYGGKRQMTVHLFPRSLDLTEVECNTVFDPTDPEHIARSNTLYVGPSGHQYIRRKFTNILPKVRSRRHFSQYHSFFVNILGN